MQVAASNPVYVTRAEVPPDALEKERAIFEEQAKSSGRPPQVIAKIVDGRLEKYYQEVCLLDQPFIKDPNVSVQDILQAAIAKTGENITINRFTRFQLGEVS
jgi:elongation factor Ts